MRKGIVLGIALACAALFVGGCSKGFNIFTPFTPAVGSLPATTANAANAYAAGDYTAAMAMYADVVTAEPANSTARYGYVKSYVKNAGFDIASFITSGTGMSSGAPKAFAPAANRIIAKSTLMIDDLQNPFGVNAKVLEGLCTVLITYLDPIANGTCDGVIPANDVGLNSSLAFAHLLKGVFLVVDPGFDGTLDYNVRDNGNGTTDVINATTLEIVTDIDNTAKAAAVAELTAAIVRLDVAIVTAGGSSIWTSVRDFLLQVQTEVNSLS
ncbi:MAG: hypothetical protein A2231_02225 [Candidatus Firestonebacteria bacterium RIFOXYA2_FULL_40_8]|nr:MAG: hypothetical protein A2231_02225 [Candidatus Firestonebacteria bacterium RIFOXYA2_FULL_40_8]